MKPKNLIQIENLSFSYSENKLILKNISLQIPAGKITAIMGGSGSGKTTVLRLISGQISPQHGTVKVFGQDISKLNYRQIYGVRRRLGLLFQFGALFTDLSVAANIAFPLRENTNLSNNFIERIVAMKLEAVGLTGTQDLMPGELSGGMARRIALARAMALDPELMLYDEPFTGLDPISLNTIAMLIKKLNDQLKQTAVLVTHDIAATMEIADYIYFMSNGEIIADGTTEEIRNSTNPAVKQFINGEISGPFEFKYPSQYSYEHYLGLK
jgi:phospholipid/cholesterol/gamma-HCH transport system ATP-binding protein